MNEEANIPEPRARRRSVFAPIRSCLTCIGCLTVLIVLVPILLVVLFGSRAASTADSLFEEAAVLDGDPKAKQTIAVIEVCGVIVDEPERAWLSAGTANSKRIVRLIRKAAKDDSVCAIIVDLNTPGGGVTASDEIRHALANCGKPVVAMMNSMAASGGYYVATAARRIVANPTTLTGSIGVVLRSYNVSKLLTTVSVEPRILTSGAQKAMLDPTLPPDKESIDLAQAIVNEMFQRFARLVATSRSIPLDKVLAAPIGDGRVLTGEQALSLNLVDRLGYFTDAVEEAALLAGTSRANCKTIRWSEEPRFADFLLSVSGKSGALNVRLPGLSDGAAFSLPPGRPYYLPASF